jgi:hypothetical protein
MDSETSERLQALLERVEAEVIADWNWPRWRPDAEDHGRTDE